MPKKTKKNKTKHQIQSNDSTAFNKTDWYGAGRKSRPKHKPVKKKYIKKSDVVDVWDIPIESGNSVINNDKNSDKIGS